MREGERTVLLIGVLIVQTTAAWRKRRIVSCSTRFIILLIMMYKVRIIETRLVITMAGAYDTFTGLRVLV